jgi:ribosomal protein L35
MSVKKMRAKTHKGTVKRIKITNGGNLETGKMVIGRINDNHRNIGKSRERLLRGRRSTTLGKTFKKLKAVM